MTTSRILLAALLCLVPATVQGQFLEAPELDESSALQQVLKLDEDQLEKLDDLTYEFGDDFFELFQRFLTQAWELQRALRPDEPNLSVVNMHVAEIESTMEEFGELAKSHRSKARAVLTPKQNFVLYNLERVLELQDAVMEAEEANLIGDPLGDSGIEDIFLLISATTRKEITDENHAIPAGPFVLLAGLAQSKFDKYPDESGGTS